MDEHFLWKTGWILSTWLRPVHVENLEVVEEEEGSKRKRLKEEEESPRVFAQVASRLHRHLTAFTSRNGKVFKV